MELSAGIFWRWVWVFLLCSQQNLERVSSWFRYQVFIFLSFNFYFLFEVHMKTSEDLPAQKLVFRSAEKSFCDFDRLRVGLSLRPVFLFTLKTKRVTAHVRTGTEIFWKEK